MLGSIKAFIDEEKLRTNHQSRSEPMLVWLYDEHVKHMKNASEYARLCAEDNRKLQLEVTALKMLLNLPNVPQQTPKVWMNEIPKDHWMNHCHD